MHANNSQLSVWYKFTIHKYGINIASCGCKPMKMVLSFKYLGVMIDSNLKWSYHIQNIKNKIRKLTVLFYKIWFLNKSTINNVSLYALCNQTLLYGINFWVNAYRTEIATVHTVRKYFVKEGYTHLLTYPLAELFDFKNTLSVFKLYNKQILIKSIQGHDKL